MNHHISALEDSSLIVDCEGPWGSLFVLAPKSHQEDCSSIDDFIWRLCVSYRPLNIVTRSFEYPILRCADSIEDLVDSCGRLMIISLDARSGYHQIGVRSCDREKLVFFTPGGNKKTYKVMPFGPKNASAFYTAMMQILREEWLILFAETKITIPHSPLPSTLICDEKIIMDDILLYSNHIPSLIHYFACIAQVFTKYRLSFKLSKCDFFKLRVEFVGHDLTALGNCPVQSKFQLIDQWPLLTTGTSLLSFIAICIFYNRYCPWFETNIKPLRRIQRSYHHTSIPLMVWSPTLISLFFQCKTNLTTSPRLLRFDSSKPVFLKTDWSATGMGFIVMQPGNSPESLLELHHLAKTGECRFDLTMAGARLCHVAFGSRSNKTFEEYYHSFVGEIASGRWSITQNKRYLWGKHFYWICD